MSNLIPITKIYDIYPKYTFSKDVMRFMDDIVDIPRAEVFSKDEVIAMFTELQLEIKEIEVAKENTEIRAGECCMKGACIDSIQAKINALKENKNEV